MNCSVYWIHCKDHTDMLSQGYVGVSNNVKKRWKEHKSSKYNFHLKNAIEKYGWENLVKEILIISTEKYCLDLELKLRPNNQIGWNITTGGGKPPSPLGKKFGPMSAESKAKISAAKKGHRHSTDVEQLVTKNLEKGVATQFKKGAMAWNKNRAMLEKEKQHYKTEVTCPHCSKTGKIAGMRRWHLNNCKQKELL